MTLLYELCEDLAGQMGEAVTAGVPDGSLTTTTFDCAALAIRLDGFFDDYYGRFRGPGPLMGKSFAVTDFVQTATVGNTTTQGKITLTPTLSAAPTATDLFYLCMDYTPEELIAAINSAIASVETFALADVVDESIVIADDEWEYPVPSTLLWINEVIQESSTTGEYSRSRDLIDPLHWNILRGSVPKLWLDDALASVEAGRHLRLVGQGKQSRLVNDDDSCSINSFFLVQQAKAILHQSRVRGAGADFEEHETQMKLAQAMANSAKGAARVGGMGRQVIS